MTEEQFDQMMQALAFISIQITRNYDATMALLPIKAREDIDKKHSEGGTYSPSPILKEDSWDV